jgi:hypothetical protein
MPKAQVLVTVTAEALVEVPPDVADVEAYCREHVALTWGELRLDSLVQSPAVTVEHYMLPEPEPEPEAVPEPEPEPVVAIERSAEDTLPLPIAPITAGEAESFTFIALFDDPVYKDVIRSAVRERAERLLEEVVNQVVAELEPLLQRHLGRNLHGAQ